MAAIEEARGDRVPAGDREIEAVLSASRALMAIAARSMAAAEEQLSVSQFRALVIVGSQGPLHLAALAEAMGVHPSNATRACDALVQRGLLIRAEKPTDRRHLELTATDAGEHLLEQVRQRRRSDVGRVLAAMPAEARRQVATVLAEFARAAGEPAETAPDTGSLPVGWLPEPRPT